MAAACAHAAPAPAAYAPVATATPPKVKTVYVEKKPEPKACTTDDQCGSAQLRQQRVCTDITSAIEACSAIRVHFDFDKSDLHPSELPALRRMSRCLEADHDVHVLIEGNADERGTVEYNLALGDRRAAAVEKPFRQSRQTLRTEPRFPMLPHFAPPVPQIPGDMQETLRRRCDPRASHKGQPASCSPMAAV